MNGEALNILLITDHFVPAFAPRMGYLVRNLRQMGHNVVVSGILKHRDIGSFGHLAGYANEVNEVAGVDVLHNKKRLVVNMVKGVCQTGKLLWTPQDTQQYRFAMEAAKRYRFNVVLCSTSSFFPIMAADKVARKLGLPLVLDFRDIYEQDTVFFSMRGAAGVLHKMQKRRRDSIVKRAAAVVSVSQWHVELLGRLCSNAHLICNGFDEELFVKNLKAEQPRQRNQGDCINIVYTGTLATPGGDIATRNPLMLFEALQRVDNAKLTVYTDDNTIKVLTRYVGQMGLEGKVELRKWVKATEVPAILSAADALLLIIDDAGTNGMMTTKMFEYMAVKRAIICLPNPSAAIEEIMTRSGTGKCMRSVDEVVAYLKNFDRDSIRPDEDYINTFSRGSQARQFAELLKSVAR